jgi:hypothetical protein
MKGALYSGLSTSEWDGSLGKYYTGGGTVRAVGGLAVTLLTEGVGSTIMKDGKPGGNEASGKGVFKLASGHTCHTFREGRQTANQTSRLWSLHS